ncbi:hypothetical protein LTR66_010472 [Elasticomyces elasticus]|nr:hypothetical protein LTR66_010472 [Elasticomyces elasticus]KAK5011379.1 hypothetical protein LTR28_003574 [Elasticomyces elasticus]
MAPVHIFGVLFPGAGHAVNLLNVANVIASDDLVMHILCMSSEKAKSWMSSTGQAFHPNLRLEILAGGLWETWSEAEPKSVMREIMSPTFATAVITKIAEVKAGHDQTHRFSAIILNGLMTTSLVPAARANNLHVYTLFPSPYYTLRLALAARATDGFDHVFRFRGIAERDEDLMFEIGDMPDAIHPMMAKLFAASVELVDGVILSGTNVAIEGHNYEQPQMTLELKLPRSTFLIGPLMPNWFSQALEAGVNQSSRFNTLPADQAECINFLNKHPVNSVVYISLGSNADFSVPQALMVISKLRKFGVPYIMLKRDKKAELVQALGEHTDSGIITEWAPQLDILAHPSMNCFLSHGGFGSMMEGIIGGTPFITCPVASDQFMDSKVMQHMKISLGSIAVNAHRFQVDRTDVYPILPDDGGTGIEELFQRLFVLPEGKAALEEARNNVRLWRRRIFDARAKEAARDLATLRQTLLA